MKLHHCLLRSHYYGYQGYCAKFIQNHHTLTNHIIHTCLMTQTHALMIAVLTLRNANTLEPAYSKHYPSYIPLVYSAANDAKQGPCVSGWKSNIFLHRILCRMFKHKYFCSPYPYTLECMMNLNIIALKYIHF